MLVQIEIKFSAFLFDLINIQTSRPTQYSLTWFTGIITATAPNNTVLNSCSSTTLSVSLILDLTFFLFRFFSFEKPCYTTLSIWMQPLVIAGIVVFFLLEVNYYFVD
jgi:hypothetical protein